MRQRTRYARAAPASALRRVRRAQPRALSLAPPSRARPPWDLAQAPRERTHTRAARAPAAGAGAGVVGLAGLDEDVLHRAGLRRAVPEVVAVGLRRGACRASVGRAVG